MDLVSGKLTWVFLVSILDAAILSAVALWWYRRVLRTLMTARGQDQAAAVPVVPHASAEEPPPRLRFALLECAAAAPPRLDGSAGRRLGIAYAVGGAVQALVITLLQMWPDAATYAWVAWPARWWTNAWPIVPTLAVILVLAPRRGRLLAGAYLAVGVGGLILLGVALQLARGSHGWAPLANARWLLQGLAVTAAVPLALILVTGRRRVRAVTPLALAATLVFGFGSVLFHEAMLRAFDVATVREGLLGLSALASPTAAYYGLFLLASLPVGWLAWRLLRALATAFDRKAFSDAQLIVDCWWLVVTADQVATLSTQYGLRALAGGLGAFAAYRTVVALVLRSGRAPSTVTPRALLLLRVFGYQARTEALFDRVAQRWRFHGPVHLIAAGDLATRTVDPGDVLALLRGRLAERYVSSATAVAGRVARLDRRADPDGRFRVNELFCHEDTWRPTVEALLDDSDVVLMDLRSFSAHNAGCTFELERLVLHRPTQAIVLIVDHTTDLARLAAVLDEAWASAHRLRCARGDGTLALVRIGRHVEGEPAAIVERLLGRGVPVRTLDASALAAAIA